jgi:hypothetical protein
LRNLCILSIALLLSSWATVSAQSLAELAKKEKERRQKVDASKVKAFDDSNLRGRAVLPASRNTTGVPSEGEEGDQATETAVEAAQEPEEDPTGTEAYWRNRLAPIDKRIDDIRARLNAPGFKDDPNNMLQRQRWERDLERALGERQTVLEEARRNGVPPGWLR